MNPLRDEGLKICKNCGQAKSEHVYVFDLPNPWVCKVTFFEEKESHEQDKNRIHG